MDGPAAEVAALRVEVETLRRKLREHGLSSGTGNDGGEDQVVLGHAQASPRVAAGFESAGHGLNHAQVARYSRQMILPSFGAQGQGRLRRGSVLVIGAGGLGSPCALYLAAAGVGRLGLVDHDVVDVSNLHRQIIHNEARRGQPKAESAALTCRAINSDIEVVAHTGQFVGASALRLVGDYDVVVDATDNAPSRYLISDACVAAGKPLVSGAAIGTDGQLTVYNHGPDGPCYRCIFPECPAPANCNRCCDAGVLGPVPGVIGTLQALEAIKLLTGVGSVLSRKLLMYDALACRFQCVTLRGRSPACAACGDACSVSVSTFDYQAFTGGQALDDAPPEPLRLLPPDQRITPAQLKCALANLDKGRPLEDVACVTPVACREGPGLAPACNATAAATAAASQQQHLLLLDTRPAVQFDIARLPGSVNIPYESFDKKLEQVVAMCRHAANTAATGGGGSACAEVLVPHCSPASLPSPSSPASEAGVSSGGGSAGGGSGGPTAVVLPGCVVVLCRRGNDSQRAVRRLREAGVENVVDMIGGLAGWAKECDPGFPLY